MLADSTPKKAWFIMISMNTVKIQYYRKWLPSHADSLLHTSLHHAGTCLDILAISCDSFNEATNIEIGRRHGNTHHVNSVLRIKQWCQTYRVAFKINTVVNSYNWEEDMTQEILSANPVRWKVRDITICRHAHRYADMHIDMQTCT